MATMIPEDIEQFTIDGEEQVYNALETVAKHNADYPNHGDLKTQHRCFCHLSQFTDLNP